MSKQTFDALSKNQQDVIMALGVEMEKFGTAEAVSFATARGKYFWRKCWIGHGQTSGFSAKYLAKAFESGQSPLWRWRQTVA
jgi:hypothetical protein